MSTMPHYDKFSSPSTHRYQSSVTPKRNHHLGMSLNSKNIAAATPTKSSFRRYSLADSRATSTPQLRNISDNIRISTDIDSKSPGYSSRIVEYYKEQEELLPVHQSRYNKLGTFPIVHFFKKDVPVLKRKSSDSNSSELSNYNSPEHNRMLLEKIIKSSPGNQCSVIKKNEGNTKSVLEALKEISRKRINPSEDEFILREDGKRVHGNYESEPNSRKRMKQNSAHVDDFVIFNSPPKTGLINELMASQSSMLGYSTEKLDNEKSDVAPQSPIKSPIKSPVSVKYVNVETQTPPEPVTIQQSSDSANSESKTQQPTKDASPQDIRKKKTSPVRIFDETPLESIRKSRLTMLVGSPNTAKPNEQPETSAADENKPVVDKPLISILSGATKSPKGNKHVTFNIPETEPSVEITFVTSSASMPPPPAPAITKTSTSMISPIVSSSAVESNAHKTLLNIPQLPIASSNEASFVNQIPTSVPIVTTSNQLEVAKNDVKPESSKLTFETPNKPSQPGGFKFQLAEPTNSPSVSFMFTTAPTSSTLSVPVVAPQVSSSSFMPPKTNFTTPNPVMPTPVTTSTFLSNAFTPSSSVMSSFKNKFPSNSITTSPSKSSFNTNFPMPSSLNFTPQVTTANLTFPPQSNAFASKPSSAFSTGFTSSMPIFSSNAPPTTSSNSFLPKPAISNDVFGEKKVVPFGGFNPTTTVSSFVVPTTIPSNTFSSSFGNFGTEAPSSASNNKFPVTQTSGFSFNLGDSSKNLTTLPSTKPFGTSTFQPNPAPSFNTSQSFAPAKTTSFGSTFGSKTTSPFAAAVTNSAFGGVNVATTSQNSQKNIFSFGSGGAAAVGNSSDASKPPIFSFGSNQPPNPSFNFQVENINSGNVFGVNNNSFVPQLNPQQSGTGMFSIGAGGTSTPTRSRMMHKTKRRT